MSRPPQPEDKSPAPVAASGWPLVNRLLLAILLSALLAQTLLLWKGGGWTVQTATPKEPAGTTLFKNRVVDSKPEPTASGNTQSNNKIQDRVPPGIGVGTVPTQSPARNETSQQKVKKHIYDRVQPTP